MNINSKIKITSVEVPLLIFKEKCISLNNTVFYPSNFLTYIAEFGYDSLTDKCQMVTQRLVHGQIHIDIQHLAQK